MKPLGSITRGTTNPNRLRRMDNWLAYAFAGPLRHPVEPLVVDLGYGATPVTAVELRRRLTLVRPDVRVVGMEIDPDRVAAAQPAADPPGLTFVRGGFELGGLRPFLVRAANVLRQYDEEAVPGAWALIRAALAPGGVLVDGTCDELGRLGSWVVVDRDAGPVSLTLAARLSTLEYPGRFATRLPKALIHHNVPGQPIHGLLSALDDAWAAAAPYQKSLKERFVRTVTGARAAGWPIRREPRRWRFGELTVPWSAVAPT